MLNQLEIFINKSKNFIRKHREMLLIPQDALVLDVGSGASPFLRADIVCDKFDEDDSQRPGRLVVDRPLVVGDISNLPFRDKAFDYVCCSHLLEHVDDPGEAIAELQRISRAGYIETPSELYEKLFLGFSFHKWFIRLHDEKLHFKKKKRAIFDKYILETMKFLLNDGNKSTLSFYKINYYAKNSPFLVRYYWRDKINYVVDNEVFSEFQTHDSYSPSNGDSIIGNGDSIIGIDTNTNNKSGPLDANLLEVIVRKIIIKALRSVLGKRSVNLDDILACPFCKQKVEKEEKCYICMPCSKAFPIKDGVPFMLKEMAEEL